MKFIVYLTTNIQNNYIYVGVHKTEDPDRFDGYIGCGVNVFKSATYKKSKTPFQYAVNTFGVDSFKRKTLQVFDSLDEALLLESIIVNEDFIKRKDTYNVALGGGSIPLNSKQTYQYDKDGNFIRTFSSKIEAAKELNVNPSSIGNAIIYKTVSCNSLWSYEKYDKLDITSYRISKDSEIVYEYDENGLFKQQYISISEVANTFNTTCSNVLRAIKGKYKIKNSYFSNELFSKFEIIKCSLKNKKLYAYDLTGKFIKEYNSVKEAVTELGIKSSSSINTAIRTGRACANYQWNTEKVECMKELIPAKPKKQKVAQYDLDGNLIKVFDSIKQACSEISPGVQKAIRGIIPSFQGYVYKKVS